MSIRRPLSRAARAEANGQRLLDAARAVFVRRGYVVATLDEIAATAGLTKGAVYARFASKADLLLALLERRIDERLADLRALPAPRSAAEAADGVFQQWLQRSRDAAWNLLVLEFRVAAARDRALNARYRALHQRLVNGVAERVAMGAAAAGTTLREPVAQVARVGLAFANGLLLERAVAGEDELSEALAIASNQALIDSVTESRPAGAARAPPQGAQAMNATWFERASNFAAALARRAEGDARTRWGRDRLLAYQQSRLDALVAHASRHSPFYRQLYGGVVDGPVNLSSLPTDSKSAMMEHFNRFVTDRRLRRDALLSHV